MYKYKHTRKHAQKVNWNLANIFLNFIQSRGEKDKNKSNEIA